MASSVSSSSFRQGDLVYGFHPDRKAFGEELKKWIGVPVERTRIAKAEKGCMKVAAEVFFGYIFEMGKEKERNIVPFTS